VDNTDNSTYLKDKYYRDTFPKKYTKDLFAFSNQFSKSYILENYATLNINKLIRETTPTTDESVNDEARRLNESELKQLKRRLQSQYYI